MDLREVLGLKNREGEYIILNSIYDKPKREDDGKYGNDLLTLVYKDIDTGKSHMAEIEKPMIEAYVSKDGYAPVRPELYYPIEYTTKMDFTYKDRALEIAKLLGEDAVKFYYDQLRNKNFKVADRFIAHKNVFSTDVDVEDFYRLKFLEEFGKTEKSIKVTKGYLDIEVDILNNEFDLDNACGDAPINIVTYVDGASKKVYTLILRDYDNPQVQELEDDIDGFIKELHENFDHNKYFKDFKYAVRFLDDELELIETLFNIINHIKPDFLLIWNMRFDIRYLIDRINRLGGDYRKIINHKDFTSDTCYMVVDNKKDKLILQNDDFVCASYTKYLDQMRVYAKVRKASSLPSYKLDAIGEKEVGEGKISYDDVGNIATFPKRNFRKFALYNIKDVLIQYAIEEKVKDVDFMITKGYESGTRLTKVFSETIYNRNLGYIYFKKQGQILGTNQNAVNGVEKTEKFDGILSVPAIVVIL